MKVGVPQGEDAQPHRTRAAVLAVCVCLLFFVSGSIGLIYEVAWKHIFATIFGNTTYAVSVVISVSACTTYLAYVHGCSLRAGSQARKGRMWGMVD